MIKKILRNILQPHKIPKKIIKKIKFYIAKKNYNEGYFTEEQNKIFKRLDLNRPEGLKKLQNIKKDMNFDNRESPMSSEHEVVFSSLSLNNNIKTNKILEIGTFDGMNSLLLSKIFPNADIDTIDLPHTERDFKNFYNRKNKIDEFNCYRNNKLKKNIKIQFIEKNSINLINFNNKYDLIWIDGAHGYPVVCADIINSLHLISPNGVILCDDIFTNLLISESDRLYNSIASFQTLTVLKEENLINLELIFKRLAVNENCLEQDRKFVAVFKKIN